MSKNKGGSEPKTKKGPDISGQKVKKARRALQSGGKRGLDAFLAVHSDIKSNPEVKRLIAKAAKLPARAPKGQRGPAPCGQQPELQPA